MRTFSALISILILGCQTEKKAIDFYEDAFKSCETKNTATFNQIGKFTESSAVLNKFDITYEYAFKQIRNGVELIRFQNNANFSAFLYSELGQKIISKYDILRQKFDTNADFKLRYELISMRSAGQLYRNNNYQDHEAKQDSIDQLHEARLIEIFETIGYPTEQIVG